MRIHVALTPAEFAACALEGSSALVVDVLRATTTVVAACLAGCRAVVPVRDPEEARRRAAEWPREQVVLAGERGGDPPPGFDLGNSPLEFTAARVGGRTVVLTTTNGTNAMLAAGRADRAALAALTNVDAAARWAREGARDVVVLCSGEQGAFALEDAVCAGLLVERLASVADECTDAAVATRRLAQHYATRLDALRQDSRWARRLSNAHRDADLDVCLHLAGLDCVPVLEDGAIRSLGRPAATSVDANGAAGAGAGVVSGAPLEERRR
jgi:2-phosphosulfolactate phosphatase